MHTHLRPHATVAQSNFPIRPEMDNCSPAADGQYNARKQSPRCASEQLGYLVCAPALPTSFDKQTPVISYLHPESGLDACLSSLSPCCDLSVIHLARSEERRVGKECRSRRSPYY